MVRVLPFILSERGKGEVSEGTTAKCCRQHYAYPIYAWPITMAITHTKKEKRRKKDIVLRLSFPALYLGGNMHLNKVH